jgi:tetratricopeptide (TPR) repeat protein
MRTVHRGVEIGGTALGSEGHAYDIIRAEEGLRRLIVRQFATMLATIVMAVILLIGGYGIVGQISRSPTNPELLVRIEDSNRELSRIAQVLLQSQPSPLSTDVLRAVVVQAEAHQKAIDELRRVTQQPSAQAESLMQLIGSAAILALLGALGLQRLQNIDTEINNLRQSVFAQISERVKENREVLRAAIDERVDEQFAKTRRDIQSLNDEATKIQLAFEHKTAQLLTEVRNETEGVNEVAAKVHELVEAFPWLQSRESADITAKIDQLSSVDQAHSLAVQLNDAGDSISAREALRVIVTRQLPGSPADFHNAHAQAMRMEEVQLGLDIVEAGLLGSPDQYDLIADKVKACLSLGRAHEARVVLEDWRERKPAEFARSWRPVVFYLELFDALDLEPKVAANVEAIVKEVTEQKPYETKPWSAYARFVRDQGRFEDAKGILLRSVAFNPLSQELNYVLGELLLREGHADEAVGYLEAALRVDHQDQFQHDVNQYAVRGTLGQAYEASGQAEKAEVLYHSILQARDPKAFGTLKEYAANRLEAIALMRGQQPKPQQNELEANDILKMLAAAAQASRANTAKDMSSD